MHRPVLHELAAQRITPKPYPFGTRGPAEADTLASRYGMTKFGGGIHNYAQAPPAMVQKQFASYHMQKSRQERASGGRQEPPATTDPAAGVLDDSASHASEVRAACRPPPRARMSDARVARRRCCPCPPRTTTRRSRPSRRHRRRRRNDMHILWQFITYTPLNQPRHFTQGHGFAPRLLMNTSALDEYFTLSLHLSLEYAISLLTCISSTQLANKHWDVTTR
jgi:hypothetical protein